MLRKVHAPERNNIQKKRNREEEKNKSLIAWNSIRSSRMDVNAIFLIGEFVDNKTFGKNNHRKRNENEWDMSEGEKNRVYFYGSRATFIAHLGHIVFRVNDKCVFCCGFAISDKITKPL